MAERAVLAIERVGPGATIQDGGRFGLLRFGVTPAGPMDPAALAIANLALGNAPDAAALEIGAGGIALGCDTALSLAFAGGAFRWERDGKPLPVAARVGLRPGETLRVRAGTSGMWCYLAVPGGFDVPKVLGSRATHLRSGLGGHEGRTLVAGDRLAVAAAGTVQDDAIVDARRLAPCDSPLRIVLGPQDDHFTDQTVAAFLGAQWRLTDKADRMAYGLAGSALAHKGDYNIVSDGVALGAVQVGGDGQPLVLMADRQPTGGYPKIGHVARVDIGRLAQLRPGQVCRFEAVSPDAARAAFNATTVEIAATPRLMTPLRGVPAAERLVGTNLIGGVTDGAD